MDDEALVAERLTKRFGRVEALDGLDLKIDAGSVVALIGPNGAGKTTLLKCWMGFERPTSGRVLTAGLDPWADRTVVGKVAFLAQQPSLHRELQVSEQLELIRDLRRSFDRALARARIESLGIPIHARIASLSGGQTAQVALAIAIGLRAPIILLDEPLANLDPLARVELLDVVRDHAHEWGATVVLSSHSIADLDGHCTHVAILARGTAVLSESISTTTSRHWVVPHADRVSGGQFIAVVPGLTDGAVIAAASRPSDEARHATLQEVAVAYLAASRADH